MKLMQISLAVNMTINDELFNKKSHWVGKSLKEIHKIIENPLCSELMKNRGQNGNTGSR